MTEKTEWFKVELLDKLDCYDEEWIIRSVCGKYEATGQYSCGELVEVTNEVNAGE